MNIGETIKLLRKEKNIKQFDLAASSGISQTYLSQIEKGTKVPAFNILEKISAALGLPFAVLSFLSLDSNALPESKREIYDKFQPVISGLIKEIFL